MPCIDRRDDYSERLLADHHRRYEKLVEKHWMYLPLKLRQALESERKRYHGELRQRGLEIDG